MNNLGFRQFFLCFRCFTAKLLFMWRALGTFLVQSRKFISVKQQNVCAFLSSRKFLGAKPSHPSD